MKAYDKLFFKWFHRFSSFIVILLLLCIIRVDYYVYLPGNLCDIKDEVTFINNDKKLNGEVSSVYVMCLTRPTLLEYLASYKLNVASSTKMTTTQKETLDVELDYAIGTFDSNRSFSNAYLASYSLLHQEEDFYKQVTYIYKADKNIESSISYTKIVGQYVCGYLNNTDHIPTYNEISTYLSTVSINEEATLYLKDKNDKLSTLIIKRRESGTFGLTFMNSYLINKESEVEINNVYTQGPSGGAMQALYMYLMMSEEDLLRGRHIAGTGTINAAYDTSGNLSTFSYVGPIGCVKQKLFSAYIDKADVFYCPEGNYDACMEAYELYLSLGYDIDRMRIVKVSDLSDIIDDLRRF